MGILTKQQIELFNSLHESRAEDFKTFNKRSWRGIWNSVIDKYPESAHFVYELLQNADDAEATEVNVIVKRNMLLFKHNGTKHFDITSENATIPGDINSITGIGDSSKTETQNKIGKFGVGFKAVFQYTDTPEIYDDFFKFKIENYIIPTLLEHDHPERKEGETLFVFPFKDEQKSYQEIIRRLENLQNPILFLRNIQKIELRIDRKANKIGDTLYYSKELLETKKCKDQITLERYILHEPSSVKSIFLFSQPVRVEDDKIMPISIGYYYDENKKRLITNIKQNIFCFFPTKETFGTCFVSHAPFLLTDNRQNLKPDNKYNESLIQFLAELAAASLVILRDYGKKTNNLLIDENLLEIIPEYRRYNWYDQDNYIEEILKEEFENVLENEALLLSRNKKYLTLDEALIATPKELINLLSKDHICMLIYKDYTNYGRYKNDFLKWEVAQKITNSRSNMYEDIKEYSSEDFGKDITSKFMNAQDMKWVTKLYTFLRTTAPKLWKVAEKGKVDYSTLVFRNAPIIQTQKGEWVAPFIDGKTPNVYLPLKKDKESGYNFISEEYLSNELAMRFFRELDIKEPNELDYIQSVILSKFRGESFEIDDDDLNTDFLVLFEYYRKVRGTEFEKNYLSILREKIYIVGDDETLKRPGELYLRNGIFDKYFDDDVVYADTKFYSSAISNYNKEVVEEFLLLLGVRKYPSIKEENTSSYYYISSPSKEQIKNAGYSEAFYYDFVLEGFVFAVKHNRIDKKMSVILWNEVLPVIDLEKYKELRVRYRRKYARTYNYAYFDSSFRCDLLNLEWLFNSDGEICSAQELFLEDLAPEYSRNNGLIEFLGIEKREKSIIELGGTEEQQKQLDFGKRIKSLIGNDLSEEEVIQAIIQAKAEKGTKKPINRVKPSEESDIDHTPSNEDNSLQESELLENRLKEKWDKKANEKIAHPHSNPQKEDLSEFAPSYNSQEDEVQPFFDPQKTTWKDKSSKPENYAAEKKLKAKDEEAKASAEKASEMVQLLAMLQDTPKFTYKWYKLLMELMHADKSNVSDRHIQIDFSEWTLTNSDKVLHLSNPSQPVPAWLNDADNVAVSTLGVKPHKIDGVLIKVDETSVDLSVEADNEFIKICGEAKKIRVVGDNSANIIDSLEKRFLQLGFDDDYDLNANLPSDIKFIYGPPGTGKTTRLVEIISQIIKDADKKTNILVLTPTNKAADVIATKMVDDDECYSCLTRFGTTESLYLIEDAAVVLNRESADMDILDNNILVTTAARYAYDYIQPDDTFICDYNWDYIVVDEASMIDIVTITYVLYKGSSSKIIISGDPKQIMPVTQNDMPNYNVYDLVELHSFADALRRYDRFPVEALTVQHRSIPSIGNLVSRFAYDGKVLPDSNRAPQKPLSLEGLTISDINFMGFDIRAFDQIYGLSSIGGSAFHLYSAIFTYNMVEYTVKQILKKYAEDNYSIGIVCPYRAEADTIKKMLENRPLGTENCSVTCGTVHSFQGDECDIMFVVLNPPSLCSINSHINNENILNVAMSRARDYLFFVLPKGQVKGFTRKNDIGRLADGNKRSIYNCPDVEKIILGSSDYIVSNTQVTCHLPVNVYYEQNAIYDVRISDDAVDIKINL